MVLPPGNAFFGVLYLGNKHPIETRGHCHFATGLGICQRLHNLQPSGWQMVGLPVDALTTLRTFASMERKQPKLASSCLSGFTLPARSAGFKRSAFRGDPGPALPEQRKGGSPFVDLMEIHCRLSHTNSCVGRIEGALAGNTQGWATCVPIRTQPAFSKGTPYRRLFFAVVVQTDFTRG